MKPIRPEEVGAMQREALPDVVIEVFNEQIALNFINGVADVKQRQVLHLLEQKLEMQRQEIVNKGWLNVEEAYRSAGWVVEYDKPGYNETYGAFFTFRRPNK